MENYQAQLLVHRPQPIATIDITLDNTIFTGSLGGDTIVGQLRTSPSIPVTWSVGGTHGSSFKVVTGSAWQKSPTRTDPTLQTNGTVAGSASGFSINVTASPTGGGSPFTKSFTLGPPAAPPLQGTVYDISPPSSSAAIQAVIDGASSGDTIRFAAGTFTITGDIHPKAGLLFIGTGVVTLQGTVGGLIVFTDFGGGSLDNCVFYGLRFQRAGINGDTVSGMVVKNCRFTTEGYTGGVNQASPIYAGNPTNCDVSWCTFTNCRGGIKWYTPNFVTVSRNAFTDVYQCYGIHPGGSAPTASNSIIAQYNYMIGAQRMGFEWHPEFGDGYMNNMVLSDNYLINYGTPITTDFGAIGFSIVPTFGSGNQILRNFVKPGDNLDTWFPTGDCHSDPGTTCHGFGIEAWCQDAMTVSDNYLNGLGVDPDFLPDAAIYGDYANAAAHVVANNNTYKNNDAYGVGGGTQIGVGSAATVTGTTHLDLGTPSPFAAGAGP